MPGHYGGMKKPAAKNKKKLSPKQKTIARMAGNPNKIEASDFAKLRSKRRK